VEPVEHYFELKDKGGPLGRINLRVFFTVLPEHRTILVLHAVKKEADGQTPQRTKILVRRRLRDFLAGIYGPLP
jgi:phage-related protein